MMNFDFGFIEYLLSGAKWGFVFSIGFFLIYLVALFLNKRIVKNNF